MHTLLSVFDTTGEWSAPYDDGRTEIIACDLKNPRPIDARTFSCEWFLEHAGIEQVDGILLAPPCTDFTKAGAQYWSAKDDDGSTGASVELALQGLRAVELFRPDFWALENPVGRLGKLVPQLGKARLTFDPCDFAGWLDLTAEDIARLDEIRARDGRGDFTQEEIELVKRTNAYTKRTCLWGDFTPPEVRRIEPVKVCAQGSWLQRLGGKSEETKAARSVTPAGFALAFHAANNWSDPAKVEAKRAALYVATLIEPAMAELTPAADIIALAREEYGQEIDAPAVVHAFRNLWHASR